MSLDVRHLDVSIAGHAACRDLNFRLTSGESLVILGRNGAGKSTLLATLAGLHSADAGRIMLHEQLLFNYTQRELAQQRGYCAQQQHDAFAATVLETALIGRHPHLGRWAWESEQDRTAAMQALAKVGLDDLAERQVQTLSGGERQRLAIATLLVQSPSLYLLDEPLSHLDLNHAMATLKLLNEIVSNGQMLIAVLHDPNLARRHFDQALLMFGDGTWACGPAAEVINQDSLEHLYGHPIRSINNHHDYWFIPE
ncbi:MAG: ABC transporter ATP-binding protein [Rhodocyclaceae bacterium]|nr:ABC transporter ATP-binding protein [Rhodocyclaceae bacterium]